MGNLTWIGVVAAAAAYARASGGKGSPTDLARSASEDTSWDGVFAWDDQARLLLAAWHRWDQHPTCLGYEVRPLP